MANLFEDSFAGAAGTSLTGRHPTLLAGDAAVTGETYAAPTQGSVPLVLDGNHGLWQANSGRGTVITPVPATLPASGQLNFTIAYPSAAAVGFLGIELVTAAGTTYSFLANLNTSAITLYRTASGGGGTNEGSGMISTASGAVNALALVYTSPTSGTGNSTFNLYLNGGSTPILTFNDSSGDPVTGATFRTDSTGNTNTGYLRAVSIPSAAASSPAFAFPANLGDVAWTGANTATVAAQTPTGGTAPYTYQWHRSATLNFTPSSQTAVAGQTGQTGTFAGLTAGTLYEVACVVGDSAGATATSDHRPVRTSGVAPLVLGIVGDSIETAYTFNGNVAACDHLARRLGVRLGTTVTPVNQAIAGTKAQDWQSGSTDLNNAIAAFQAAGVTVVSYRLGMNDAQSGTAAATVGGYYASGINALVAAGFKVVANYPTWREPGQFFESTTVTFDESTAPLLLAYQGQIDALVNGTTIVAGDKRSFYATAQQPAAYLNRSLALPGGIHPHPEMAEMMGGFEADAIYDAFYAPATATPSPTPTTGGLTAAQTEAACLAALATLFPPTSFDTPGLLKVDVTAINMNTTAAVNLAIEETSTFEAASFVPVGSAVATALATAPVGSVANISPTALPGVEIVAATAGTVTVTGLTSPAGMLAPRGKTVCSIKPEAGPLAGVRTDITSDAGTTFNGAPARLLGITSYAVGGNPTIITVPVAASIV